MILAWYFLVLLLPLSSIYAKPRLISTSPQVTELMFQLGVGSDVVAASQPSDFPNEAKTLPSVGSLLMPSIEKTLRFKPDLVLGDHSFTYQAAFAQAVSRLNISHWRFRLSDPKEVLKEARAFLGNVYPDKPTPALLTRAEHCLNSATESGESFTYLLFVWANPPIVLGESPFLSQLLKRVGGTNLVPAHLKHPFPQVSEEWLIRQAPDRIYFMGDDVRSLTLFRPAVSRWWPTRNYAVRYLDSAQFGRASLTPFFSLAKLGFSVAGECHE